MSDIFKLFGIGKSLAAQRCSRSSLFLYASVAICWSCSYECSYLVSNILFDFNPLIFGDERQPRALLTVAVLCILSNRHWVVPHLSAVLYCTDHGSSLSVVFNTNEKHFLCSHCDHQKQR